jgi:hypothetical protein
MGTRLLLFAAFVGCGKIDAASDVGPQGPPGANGSAGAKGDKGDPGASGAPGTVDNIPGLVAYYRGKGVDLSGNGVDATANGTVPLVADRFDVPATAASFNGAAANFLTVTNAALPVGTAPRTVSVWFATTGTFSPIVGSLFNYGESAATGLRFGAAVAGAKDDFIGQFADLPGTATVNDGQWHQLVVTYDGTTVTLFVDARFSASAAIALDTLGQILRIGASAADRATPEPFTGSIDDLRIYDRVLTRTERGLLFQEGGFR